MNKSKIDRTDLTQMSKYSMEQQACVVKLLIEDVEFRQKAIDLIDINSLNADEGIRTIAGYVKELHSKGAVFDYHTLVVMINSKVSDNIRRERCLAFLNDFMKNSEMSPAAINYLKADLYPMLMVQEGRRLQGKLTDMLRNEKVSKDELMEAFKDFDKRTTFNECTYERIDSSIDTVARMLEEDKYEVVPTSSKLIDMALGGGLRKGDVGLLLAGSGVAKTCISTSFVCWNAFKNKKVAHFVLEDKKDDIIKKYIAFITNIQPYEQHKRKAEVLERLDKYYSEYEKMLSNIRGVFATKNNSEIKIMSTNDIDKELERMVNDGFVPDLVIVDYYDRIKKNGKEVWMEDERIINELLVIATKYNVALWCPTQGGKAAQSRYIDLGLDNMSGGTWKTYGAQVAIAVQQKGDDIGNTYTLTVMKNRNYPKMELKFEFSNGTCRFVNEDETIKSMNETSDCIDRIFEDYKYRKAMETKNNSK